MEKKPKSFILYLDFLGPLMRLSVRERGILFTKIYEYANGEEMDEAIKTTSAVEMAFAIIRTHMDRDMEKYDRVCMKNSENGKRGGRPRKNAKGGGTEVSEEGSAEVSAEETSKETEGFSEKPQKAYNNNKNNNNNYNYNKNKNYTYNNNNNNNMRSFDADEFFAAALARPYGEEKEKEKEK